MLLNRIKNRLCRYYFPEQLAASRIKAMSPNTGVVLMYHEVLPDNIDLPAWTIVRESDFQWQMRFLKKHFDVISIAEAEKRISGTTSGDRPFAVVTFDDGYSGNLNTVLPVMTQMNLPFTIYVATRSVEKNSLFWYDKIINLLQYKDTIHIEIPANNQCEKITIPYSSDAQSRWKSFQHVLSLLKTLTTAERENLSEQIVKQYMTGKAPFRMLSSTEIKKLSESELVTIGSHTHGHELLDQLAPAEIKHTLETSSQYIKQWAGKHPEHFAYPNGNYNNETLKQIDAFEFKTAVTTMPGRWQQGISSLEIPRISIGRFESDMQFKARVSGFI